MAHCKLNSAPGNTSNSCSQAENGLINSISLHSTDRAMQNCVQQPSTQRTDDHLIEFSEAMRTVAKALRRAAEEKAFAQAEAADWKRKYEYERARNLQIEHKGNPVSGYDICENWQSWWLRALDRAMRIIRIILPCIFCCNFLKERDMRVLEEQSPGRQTADLYNRKPENLVNMSGESEMCCGRHGICSQEVLRDRENDTDSTRLRNMIMRKAPFKLSWWCNGEQGDQQKHDIVSFERGDITTTERSNRQIALKWESHPKTVLILAKPNATSVQILCAEMIRWLKESKELDIYVEPRVKVELLTESSYFNFLHSWKDDEEISLLHRKVDLVVTLGGDGTVLWAASMFKGPVPPIVAFSLGSLGFTTPFHSERYTESLDSVLKGPISITLRHRLQCHIIREEAKHEFETEEPILVLNEVTVDRGISPFLTNLECYCDNYFVTRVQGDGLILSTTSGSTAYSLAAGGSMVHPQVPGILFTPLCPHSLSFRPLILPEHVTLRVQVPFNSRSHAWVSFDGKDRRRLAAGDALLCSMAPWPVPTACQVDSTSDFFRSIHEGLHWNHRKVQSFDGPQEL